MQVLTPDLAEALGLKGRTGVRITQLFAGAMSASMRRRNSRANAASSTINPTSVLRFS